MHAIFTLRTENDIDASDLANEAGYAEVPVELMTSELVRVPYKEMLKALHEINVLFLIRNI